MRFSEQIINKYKLPQVHELDLVGAERLSAKNPYNQFPEVPDISSDIIKFESISTMRT